ncbi:MAG: hypothetical protein ACLPWO_06610 [Thermoplasmata archaeon]
MDPSTVDEASIEPTYPFRGYDAFLIVLGIILVVLGFQLGNSCAPNMMWLWGSCAAELPTIIVLGIVLLVAGAVLTPVQERVDMAQLYGGVTEQVCQS